MQLKPFCPCLSFHPTVASACRTCHPLYVRTSPVCCRAVAAALSVRRILSAQPSLVAASPAVLCLRTEQNRNVFFWIGLKFTARTPAHSTRHKRA